MQKLTKDGALERNDWRVIGKDESLDSEQDGCPCLVHADALLSNELLKNRNDISLWLDADDDIESVRDIISSLSIIGINFPAFADGRGFSLAQQLRADLNFKGEIIALGQFMEEQLYYLKRCGFDSFILDAESDISAMQLILKDFTDNYQASTTEPKPLFKRRTIN